MTPLTTTAAIPQSVETPPAVGGSFPASSPTCAQVESTRLRHLLIGLVGILLATGIQMVLSSSLTSRPSAQEEQFLARHLMFLAVAIGAGWMASHVQIDWLKGNAGILFWCLIFLLIVVLIPGLGSRINGARRWLRISSLSVQPSEFGRLVLPLIAAVQLERFRVQSLSQDETLRSLRSIPAVVWPAILLLPLVAVEPDLGATVFLGSGFVLTLFLGGWPLQCFVAASALLIPAVAGLLILRPYQLDRISGYLSAWQDLNEAPWQVRQSLMSLGAGGLEGAGVGAGWQKLSYLPEANTDFVFAVIGEELGLAGTLTICIVWVGILLVGLSLTSSLPRRSFRRTLSTALLLQLVGQAAINICVVTALVPPKGVPHPFISYGGTNLLVSVIAVGLIVGLTRPQSSTSQPDGVLARDRGAGLTCSRATT
jgi:cell division protein FtsW